MRPTELRKLADRVEARDPKFAAAIRFKASEREGARAPSPGELAIDALDVKSSWGRPTIPQVKPPADSYLPRPA